MDSNKYKETVQYAVKPKFRGRKRMISRSAPRYPNSAERELRRITKQYEKILNDALKAHMPAIMAAYKQYRAVNRTDARFDEMSRIELDRIVREELNKVAAEVDRRLEAFGLEKKLTFTAKLAQSTSLREWKRVCRDTLGIDLMSDYYNGDFYAQEINTWVSENVSKIKTLPVNTLSEMEQIINDGFRQGKTIRDLQRDIQQEYNVSNSWAEYLARDQMGTLNADIAKRQQEDAGVTKYKWSTSDDQRVRPCHQELDGKIFSWDDPPEMWYETKQGRVYTGRHCHPGQDYQCRCVAIPVFEFDTLDAPMKDTGEEKK